MVVSSDIEPLEVDPVTGILQELVVGVIKNIFLLAKAMVEDIWVIPHGFKIPFSQLIIGLVVNEDQISFAKDARVDMGVKM